MISLWNRKIQGPFVKFYFLKLFSFYDFLITLSRMVRWIYVEYDRNVFATVFSIYISKHTRSNLYCVFGRGVRINRIVT